MLPELRHCTVEFLHQLLLGTKKHLIAKNCATSKVPLYDEFASKRLMPVLVKFKQLVKYLPTWESGKREPNRDFLLTVVATLQPDYAKRLTTECLTKRDSAAAL